VVTGARSPNRRLGECQAGHDAPVGPDAWLADLASTALRLDPLTAGCADPEDASAPTSDGLRRFRLLLDACGWTADVRDVLVDVREEARQHAVWLRQAAVGGFEPAIERVALGVAGEFDRAVVELADLLRELPASRAAARRR